MTLYTVLGYWPEWKKWVVFLNSQPTFTALEGAQREANRLNKRDGHSAVHYYVCEFRPLGFPEEIVEK